MARVMIQVESEGGTEILSIEEADAVRIRQLLQDAEIGEWPDEVNELLDKGRSLSLYGVVNTMGDGWGWYEGEE